MSRAASTISVMPRRCSWETSMSALFSCAAPRADEPDVRGDPRAPCSRRSSGSGTPRTAPPAPASASGSSPSMARRRASAAARRSRPARRPADRARGAGTFSVRGVELARAASPSSWTWRRARPRRDRRRSAGTARAGSPRRRTACAKSEIMPMSSRSRRCDICPMTRCWRTRNSTRRMSSSSMPSRRQMATASPAPISLCGLPYGLPTSCSSVPSASATGRVHLLDRLGRHRELLGVVAARERVQPPDRVERVLVDGVDVIDVVLHAARWTAPTRA